MGTDSHSAQLAHKPNVAQSPRKHTQHIHTRSLSDKHTDSRWFSQLISSTHRPPPRPASTNSRRSSQRHAPSSWASSAQAASQSPPSSRTPRQSLCARAARRSCASPPVARPVSERVPGSTKMMGLGWEFRKALPTGVCKKRKEFFYQVILAACMRIEDGISVSPQPQKARRHTPKLGGVPDILHHLILHLPFLSLSIRLVLYVSVRN